jgi:hypothetical protein
LRWATGSPLRMLLFPRSPSLLVVLATALAIEDSERPWRKVLVLLALPGLLRPEASALSIGYDVAWVIGGGRA